MRKLAVRAAAAIALVAGVIGIGDPASAVQVNCLSPHCYSIMLMNTSQQMTGVYGDWNANYMTPGSSSSSNPWFTTAEMWLKNPSNPTGAWVEAGLANDWTVNGFNAYDAYWADSGPSGYWEHLIENTTPNGVNRKFQISRAGPVNQWNIFYKAGAGNMANIGLSTNSTFWSTNQMDTGAEFFNNSPLARADNFHMNVRAIDGNGISVLWPGQVYSIHSGFDGYSYSQSTWDWHKNQ
jgi:hypothetical protein